MPLVLQREKGILTALQTSLCPLSSFLVYIPSSKRAFQQCKRPAQVRNSVVCATNVRNVVFPVAIVGEQTLAYLYAEGYYADCGSHSFHGDSVQ